MSILKSTKKELVLSGAAYLAIGLVMCCWPVGAAGLMCVLAGAVLVAAGIIRASAYFRKKDYGFMPRMDFAMAAVGVIVGAVLIVKRDIFIMLVPFILGVIILVNSVFLLQTALELKKIGFGAWVRHLVVSLVCALAALVMMFDPFGSYRVMAAIMGAAFILDGAADLWTALYLKGKLKKLGLM